VAVDQATGLVLSAEQYLNRFGAIVVNILLDPQDATAPMGKDTLQRPESWCITVPGESGPVYVQLFVDDGNRIIGSRDTHREWAGNPASIGLDDITGIEVVVPGVDNGTWYVGATLDIGGDDPDGPGLEDLDGTYAGGVSVSGGTSIGGVNCGLGWLAHREP
jgi:hypothetical protein